MQTLAHLRIFLNIIALLMGAWSIRYAWQMRKMYSDQFLSPLLGFLLFLNLFIFNDLVDWYLMTNLYHESGSFERSFYGVISFPVVYLLFMCYSYFQIRILLDFHGEMRVPVRRIYGGLLLASLSMILYSKITAENQLHRWFHWTVFGMVYAVYGFRLVLLIKTLAVARHRYHGVYSRMIVVFAWFYIAGIALSFAVQAVPGLPQAARLAVTSFEHFAAAVFPLLWFRYCFMPFKRSFISDESTRNIFERKWKQFGISKREREIAELVLQGLKNREIERILIISPHTVKNHVYHLYKKVGVNSRSQFVRLMMENESPEP